MNLSKRIIKGWKSPTLRVMSLTFFGMLLAWVADILMAAKLGTSQTTDALIVALSLPRLIDTVSREGTRQSLVPMFMERRDALSHREYHRLVSGIVNLALVLGVSLTILLEILAPLIITGLAPGFSPEGRAQATFLFRVCAPMVLFAPGIAVFSVILNSQRRFSAVALRNAIAPGFVVAAIGLGWQQSSIALWIAYAYTLGFAGFFVLVFLDAFKAGHQHQWLAWAGKDDLLRLWQAGSLPTIGFVIKLGSNLVKSQMLPSLVAVGGVSTFYFAIRIVSAAQTIIGVSIATTSLPAMTEHDLAGHKSRLGSALRKNLTKTLLVSLPAVLFIVVSHGEIIRLLYGHGSFEATSIEQTSQVFLWLGLSLAFISLIPVLEAGLYAQRAYGLVVWSMVTMAFVGVALSWLFWQVWGLIGIAMSWPVMAIIYVILIIYLLHQKGVSLLKNHSS